VCLCDYLTHVDPSPPKATACDVAYCKQKYTECHDTTNIFVVEGEVAEWQGTYQVSDGGAGMTCNRTACCCLGGPLKVDLMEIKTANESSYNLTAPYVGKCEPNMKTYTTVISVMNNLTGVMTVDLNGNHFVLVHLSNTIWFYQATAVNVCPGNFVFMIKGGLSVGAIVGIAIGCFVGVAAIAALALYLRRGGYEKIA